MVLLGLRTGRGGREEKATGGKETGTNEIDAAGSIGTRARGNGPRRDVAGDDGAGREEAGVDWAGDCDENRAISEDTGADGIDDDILFGGGGQGYDAYGRFVAAKPSRSWTALLTFSFLVHMSGDGKAAISYIHVVRELFPFRSQFWRYSIAGTLP